MIGDLYIKLAVPGSKKKVNKNKKFYSDISITDYCEEVCIDCFKRCNKKGKHALAIDIISWLDFLKKKKVDEINITGGEPTHHPEFIKILEYCCENEIKTTFSTRNYNWLIRNLSLIPKQISRIRYSKDYSYEISNFAYLMRYRDMVYDWQDRVIFDVAFVDDILGDTNFIDEMRGSKFGREGVREGAGIYVVLIRKRKDEEYSNYYLCNKPRRSRKFIELAFYACDKKIPLYMDLAFVNEYYDIIEFIKKVTPLETQVPPECDYLYIDAVKCEVNNTEWAENNIKVDCISKFKLSDLQPCTSLSPNFIETRVVKKVL